VRPPFMKFLLIICLLVAAGTSPFAGTAEGDTGRSAEVENNRQIAQPAPNKRVCKKVKPTGSHIAQRVCLKQREWDAMQQEARERMSRAGQHNANSGS